MQPISHTPSRQTFDDADCSLFVASFEQLASIQAVPEWPGVELTGVKNYYVNVASSTCAVKHERTLLTGHSSFESEMVPKYQV